MPTPDDDEVAEFLEADEPAPKPDRSSPGKEPAWRAKLRSSNFGQAAVVLVTAFAIAVAAWWVVKPEEQDRVRAGTEAVSQVEVAGVQQPPAAGDSAPGFTATDIDGTPISLEGLRGKPVWLVFMATWCTGCRTEIPDIQGVVASRGDAVRVVVIYVGESRNTVSDYSKRVGNDFPEVVDQDQQISAAYGIMGVPTHYFIDAGGVVRQRHVGVLSPDAMTQAIQNAMSS
ncbi:TlpA family protein disulfide reductase [Arachnia propionica]|jgi:alkyl hydroperoxide reductase/ thiol specific antioxidant/ mal allergen|uniref:Thiol-disulfide oxidoreductase resA n=1 Tax=Arachnia propionica TaxID=1750 RepID=A0A3N4D2D1_9ACTN|nr:TlpA disulfide reductase family protein [Arachnia propionica]QCT38162.1 TlpA family protein disulfide reductase [Arachnia propionica]QUC12253.1 TlpA family protein disulfide reductase [Arachnia propionica]RPA19054.1 TlpA family protein disulfide reductase [Arachnia propionica]VEH70597.1 Thiol-disulfide oxidoreductase resA [Arachnia propionica]